ncbi:MAG: hypothetical protein ACR2HP_04590 [Ilumatobacteraceae bacterium]
MKKMLVAMALGAALAWLFDPDAGSRRRDAVRSKLERRGMGGTTPASAPQSAMRSTSSAVDNGASAPTVASIP